MSKSKEDKGNDPGNRQESQIQARGAGNVRCHTAKLLIHEWVMKQIQCVTTGSKS